jgi:hypothetical protein
MIEVHQLSKRYGGKIAVRAILARRRATTALTQEQPCRRSEGVATSVATSTLPGAWQLLWQHPLLTGTTQYVS